MSRDVSNLLLGVVLGLLIATGCVACAPADDTAARMAALRAHADRADLALTRVELHEARKPGHRWATTANGDRVIVYCLHCSAQYHTRREIGGQP